MPRFSGFNIWEGVANGVITSVDVDDAFQLSPVIRTQTAPLLPFQRQRPAHPDASPPPPPPPPPLLPPLVPPPSRPRRALGSLDANVIRGELRVLEKSNQRLLKENNALKRQVHLQNLCVRQLAELATNV